MRVIVVVLAVLLPCCSRGEISEPAPRVRDDAPRARTAGIEATSRKAETTPEVVERAERILAEHGDAPVGTEIPFTLNGKRYVARVETHDNPDAAVGRPPGEHKGITVYVAP
jgi:hypothetical protein